MFRECPDCRRRNPHNARFCATCGRRLDYARCGPATKSGSGGAGLALGLVLIALFLGFRPLHLVSWGRRAVTRATAQPTVRREFNLPDDKADAFYRLIAPSDIKVIVGRREGGVFIKGTPSEAESMTRFAELLTRLEGRDGNTVEHIINSLRSQPTETETYLLLRSKVNALINILKFKDVPVLVSGGGRKVRVIAAPNDQQTIREVVHILHGER
jgi:hypothetical protein